MTTILTPVERLKQEDEFMIGAARYEITGELEAWAIGVALPHFELSGLAVIFPDGVPVIQPDKPKKVRAVIERTGNVFYVHLYPNPTVMGWVLDHTDPGKTYDLVLTEREEK